jgi:hypothetical protein
MIEDQHQLIEMPREVRYTPHLYFAVEKRETPLRIRRICMKSNGLFIYFQQLQIIETLRDRKIQVQIS